MHHQLYAWTTDYTTFQIKPATQANGPQFYCCHLKLRTFWFTWATRYKNRVLWGIIIIKLVLLHHYTFRQSHCHSMIEHYHIVIASTHKSWYCDTPRDTKSSLYTATPWCHRHAVTLHEVLDTRWYYGLCWHCADIDELLKYGVIDQHGHHNDIDTVRYYIISHIMWSTSYSIHYDANDAHGKQRWHRYTRGTVMSSTLM